MTAAQDGADAPARTRDPRIVTAAQRREQVSHSNLGTIATLVHHHRTITRAQLTSLTGLNRSTVGSLVAQLEDIGLVVEGPPVNDNRVGRPSPAVSPRTDVVALAVTIDLDAVTATVVGLGATVHASARVDFASPVTAADAIAAAQSLMTGRLAPSLHDRYLVGVSFAVPGLVRTDDGTVTMAPRMNWRNVPLGERAAQAFSVPVFVGNDATLAMVAESTFGAAQDYDDVIYLNGSASGIGGGAMVGGRPLVGADGYAGELGHTLVASQGRPCHCGRRGCLETEVSAQRLAPLFDGVSVRQLLDAIPPVNGTAGQELDHQADVLGHGIANLISVFNPAVVVLGGYLAALFEARTERVEEAMATDSFHPLADHVTIERASLGTNVVAVGAAELALGAIVRQPTSFAH